MKSKKPRTMKTIKPTELVLKAVTVRQKTTETDQKAEKPFFTK